MISLHELVKDFKTDIIVKDRNGKRWKFNPSNSTDWSGYWAFGLDGQRMKILHYKSTGYEIVDCGSN